MTNRMTPPLPLTSDQRAILALTARVQELEASLPLGRCETCRHMELGSYGEPTCLHPSLVAGSYGSCSYVVPPQPFGCTLHEPAPPAAGEETRDGK